MKTKMNLEYIQTFIWATVSGENAGEQRVLGPSVSYSRVARTAAECCVAGSAYLMLDTQVVM